MIGYINCQTSEADTHRRQTRLEPMATGEQLFEEIARDILGELPESEAFNAILVVIDWFTKVQPYIPAKTTWTVEDVTDFYINNIWKLCGLPKQITLDRCLQFTLNFLNQLNRKLNINLHFSTAYHLQIDELSK